jgi:hypothetical protein
MTHPIPDAALLQHVIALGKTGSGKSSALRSQVERLLDLGRPVCIVDPKGDWYGLRSGADGRSPGYPIVIFGGDHADVPINAHAGAAVAELIATGNRPALIDLGGWMVGERTRFWIDFASTLFRATRGPRWLVIDEVHNFAPQGKILDPDAGKALHWSNRLASEGRGKGLTILAASQRPQKVHKDFLTSAETLIALRVVHPLDRGAIKDWIDGCPDPAKGREVLQTLASLPRGEAWVWSPEIGFGPERIRFPKFRTFDSFSPREDGAAPLAGWAEVDLADVRARLAAVVQEAEANDPATLRARIRQLEAQLVDVLNRPSGFTADVVEDARRAGYRNGVEAGFTLAAEAAKKAFDAALLSTLADGSATLAPEDTPVTEAWIAEQVRKEISDREVVLTATRAPHAPPAAGVGGSGKRRILIALAQFPAGLKPRRAALLAGLVHGSGTWSKYLGQLRSAGHVESDGDRLRITSAGKKALGRYEPLPTDRALIAYWQQWLGDGGQRRIFDVLIAEYPRAVPPAAVAAAAGLVYGSGTWSKYIGRLRSLELVTGRDRLKASDDLFTDGDA